MKRVAVISGGSGAIGAGVCAAFGDAGFTPVSIDLVAPSLDIPFVAGDLRVEDPVRLLARAAEHGRVEHVVGVAGGALNAENGHRSEAELQHVGELPSPALFAASLDQNLVCQYKLVWAAAAHLKAAAVAGARPSVTLTSSINALASYGLPAYSSAKAGLHGLMAALVDPLGAEGIRVNVLAPGTVRTPRAEREWEHVPGHLERLEATTALRRLATPQGIGSSVLALATMLTDTTGQVLVADCGQLPHRG